MLSIIYYVGQLSKRGLNLARTYGCENSNRVGRSSNANYLFGKCYHTLRQQIFVLFSTLRIDLGRVYPSGKLFGHLGAVYIDISTVSPWQSTWTPAVLACECLVSLLKLATLYDMESARSFSIYNI